MVMHDPEVVIHEVTPSPKPVHAILDTNETSHQRLTDSRSHASSTATTPIPSPSPSPLPASMAGVTLARRASFAEITQDEMNPPTPSVVVVNSDQSADSQAGANANTSKHHRKRSRGRNNGSVSRKVESRPTPTTAVEIVKSVGMFCIIILLMVLCFMLGRLQGGAQTALPWDFFSTSPSPQPTQTMAQPQPRLARQHL